MRYYENMIMADGSDQTFSFHFCKYWLLNILLFLRSQLFNTHISKRNRMVQTHHSSPAGIATKVLRHCHNYFRCCGIMHITSIFFVQCVDEFEAMCSKRKSSTEEPRLIDVDEITCIQFMWGYRQIRFVHVLHFVPAVHQGFRRLFMMCIIPPHIIFCIGSLLYTSC
jgi:hypothetical protein